MPRDFETILLKCLRKDAGDRYGTAEALGQEPTDRRQYDRAARALDRLRRAASLAQRCERCAVASVGGAACPLDGVDHHSG